MLRHAFLALVCGSSVHAAEPARERSPVPSYLGALAEEEGVPGGQPQAWASRRLWSQVHALGDTLPLAIRNAPSPELQRRANLLPR